MRTFFASTMIGLAVIGCSEAPEERADPQPSAAIIETAPAQPASPLAAIRKELGIGKEGVLKAVGGELFAVNLQGTKAKSLEPLAGLNFRHLDIKDTAISDLSPIKDVPIEELYAENSKVESLEPLKDVPLTKLYLSQTAVSDLSPLAGKRLDELNLVDSQVADLSPLSTSSIGTLWLRRCPVEDLAPISDLRLVSLDVGETKVADLSPLAGMSSLRRLHIAGTEVTDLTPIIGLKLERLVFSPWKIKKGLDELREMTSLQQLDVTFDDASGNALRPDAFWERWDAGEIEGSGQLK